MIYLERSTGDPENPQRLFHLGDDFFINAESGQVNSFFQATAEGLTLTFEIEIMPEHLDGRTGARLIVPLIGAEDESGCRVLLDADVRPIFDGKNYLIDADKAPLATFYTLDNLAPIGNGPAEVAIDLGDLPAGIHTITFASMPNEDFMGSSEWDNDDYEFVSARLEFE